jgi:hypothetical protein
MGRTAARKPHLDFLTITTEYNSHGLLHAILIWTPSQLKRLQVTWTACKTHLDSLTIKGATGDMDCMQASFGLPHN